MLRRMGWVLTKGLGASRLGTKTSVAHIITPPHLMFRSAVEVPDVNAIINTLRPHPVVTSVEGRQWLSLPHTTIQIQGTPLISLLDSGSEVTCINEENFIALKAHCRCPHLVSWVLPDNRVRGSSGKDYWSSPFQA
jgi:hypothetical protein